MVDQVANFKKVTVSTGYNNTATSIVLATGQGAELPDPSGDNYNVVWWDITNYNDPADDPNVEIVRVTAKSTDTLTVTRNQEGSAATNKNNADATYKMILATTAKTITDLIPAHSATVIVGKSGNVDYLTTDYGSDDACIQAAIDYVNGLGGGSVLIREGNYIIIAVIKLYDDIHLSGVGVSTKLTLANSTNSAIIENYQQTSPGNSNIELSNMFVDGNGDNQSDGANLIKFVYSKYTSVHDVYTQDAYQNNIRIGSASHDSNVYNCRVVNTISQGTGISIYVSGNNMSHVNCCYIYGAYTHGVSLNNSDHSIVSNCIFEDSGHWGATCENGSTDSIISSCTSYNSGKEGFNIQDPAIRCEIVNCTVHTTLSDYGISVPSNFSTVEGCIIYYAFKSGISVNATNCTIIGNTIIDCAVDTAGGALDSEMCGISLHTNTEKCLVQNNNIIDTRGTKKHIYSIGEFGVSPLENFILNNVINGFLTGGILKAATNTIVVNNVGFNPIGNFTAPSVPATTVNYTNAYGYPCAVVVSGGTVTEIDIDDIATGLTSGVMPTIPPGGTINITYSAAPSWLWWGL